MRLTLGQLRALVELVDDEAAQAVQLSRPPQLGSAGVYAAVVELGVSSSELWLVEPAGELVGPLDHSGRPLRRARG